MLSSEQLPEPTQVHRYRLLSFCVENPKLLILKGYLMCKVSGAPSEYSSSQKGGEGGGTTDRQTNNQYFPFPRGCILRRWTNDLPWDKAKSALTGHRFNLGSQDSGFTSGCETLSLCNKNCKGRVD